MNLRAVAWRDGKVKSFVGTCGTTVAGVPHKKNRWRNNNDGTTNCFTVDVARPNLAGDYFDGAQTIDRRAQPLKTGTRTGTRAAQDEEVADSFLADVHRHHRGRRPQRVQPLQGRHLQEPRVHQVRGHGACQQHQGWTRASAATTAQPTTAGHLREETRFGVSGVVETEPATQAQS